MPVPTTFHRRAALGVLAIVLVSTSMLLPPAPARGALDHLVVSEIVTGGASASDELIEVHNPTGAPLPLEGLELVYVSASGLTVSRRADWPAGAPEVPPGGHVLVANEAGVYAAIADATYASGMAATGGSVAIRVLGASTAVDAVGWGTATGSWLEGAAAPAPAPGASLERLPGGAAGSGQDTDSNAADLVERAVPDPQNLASAPTLPDSQPPPTDPTPAPPDLPPAPSEEPPAITTLPIASARQLPDGARATIEGVALTASDFDDGGGFVADTSAGIAVLLDGGSFSRGALLRLTGEVDDRFAQRTLRVDSTDVEVLGTGAEPVAQPVTTGSIGEAGEGSLARIAATIVGGRTELAAGVAFDVDDGSGPVRLLATAGSGIDTASWATGMTLEAVGVIGQRDSSGTGGAGYRLMLRDANDVIAVGQPEASPSPTPAAATPSPAGSQPPAEEVVAIAEARAAERNANVSVAGTVTLPPGVVDAETAVIQDDSGAIVLRLGDGVGTLRLGDRVQVTGTRSTKAGMETLRVTDPVQHLGAATLPEPKVARSGELGEADEALRIEVRGSLVASARRSSSGSVTFDLDDGSGPIKVAMGAGLGAEAADLAAGTWVQVTGVLGQQTTGSAPASGYRLWPATTDALVITAAPEAGGEGGGGQGGGDESGAPADGLEEVGSPGLDDLRIGATLVMGPWPELGVGGLLWDGQHLVAVDAGSSQLVDALLGGGRPPVALDLGGLVATGVEPRTGIPRVALGTEPDDAIAAGPPAAPTARPGAQPAWASVIGLALGRRDRPLLLVPGRVYQVQLLCDDQRARLGLVQVTGIALHDPSRLVVGCGGMRPVPLLGWRGSLLAATDGAHGGQGTPSLGSSSSPQPARPLAAGMLAVAALAAAGTAAVARLRRRPPDPEARSGAEEGRHEAERPQLMDAGPPHLTLVRVPREHGP